MILRWIRRTWHRIGPDRRVIVVQGDSVAVDIRTRHLYLAREDGEDRVIAMRCPCGCGDTLELMVLQNAVPR